MDDDLVGTLSKLYDVYKQLGDREPSTLVEAQSVTENIRAEKGHLDAETLQELRTLGHRSQERVLRIVQLKRETEAAYTTNISEQLYSSKYRFLYELIQNADDSSYRKAKARGALPFLRFEVTQDTLIAETNEDGFSRANIEAICATGRSSKKALETDKHIGEKGFGFKSVFSVADKVQIQSGLWSFCFRHRRGEDGLGMVTPLDASSEVLPEGVTTRITLRYSKSAKKEYSRLVEAVKDLPDTMVLFLQTLRTIHINVTGTDAEVEKMTFTKFYNIFSRCATINLVREQRGTKQSDASTFLLFRTTKENMPSHERRKNQKKTEIELAFPIDPNTKQPKMSELGQHIFAYLPLQRLSQIQFLIQSDFVTSASRESVVDCSWNNAICDGVAQAFVSVVSGTFAKADHPLRYSWLDYLPQKPMEHPWKSLCSSIQDSLKTKPVLQTREGRRFKAPTTLRQLPVYTLHHGEPIFRDLADEIYLAPEYSSRHWDALTAIGVKLAGWDDIIARLQADIVRPEHSKLRNIKASDPWHESFADLFLRVFSNSSLVNKQQILKMQAIIPLTRPNQWTGAPGMSKGGSEKVYFAYTGSSRIPDSISLRLLDETASVNAKRKALYKALGVEECPKAIVFAKIKEAHLSVCGPSPPEEQLQYLFHQQHQSVDIKSWVYVRLIDGNSTKASSASLYFPSDGEYDTYKLLREQTHVAKFLSKSLVNLEPATVRVNNEDWKTWLARITGARYHPPLIDPSNRLFNCSLSPELRAILQHNPTKFMGTLRAHWNEYQPEAHLVRAKLRECEVLCRSGSSLPLHTTYLPTSEILTKISELGISEKKMPLLSLPDALLDESTYRSWRFVKDDCGAHSEPDMAFYKLAIEAMSSVTSPPYISKVSEVYQGMARLATVESHDDLRAFFGQASNIWVAHRKRWLKRSGCLWDGPDFISHKAVLTRSYSGNALLQSFFTTILGISTWTIKNILQEIEKRRDRSVVGTDLSLMRTIYAFLNSNASSDEDWQTIQNAFVEKQLILGQDGSWFTLGACLWKSPFAISGIQDLSIIYSDLEDFFVKRMGVKRATPSMLINEVKRMAGQTQPQIPAIRTRLIEIGMMLSRSTIDDSISRALDALKEVKFLPKKTSGGRATLVGVTDDFAISDHRRYSEALAEHHVMLDFKVDEVQILHVMFQYMGLTQRYLSVLVQEVSTIGEDPHEDESLSRQLQAKAYALYCCAAKYKSSKALRNDRVLFDQLSQAVIYTTDDISTNLVLPLGTDPLSIQSDRLFIHHEISNDRLKIYVPTDRQKRRACYRSQLPKLLASILSVEQYASLSISIVIASSLRDLDDVLVEQDISPVDWIEKPMIEIPDVVGETRPHTPNSTVEDSDAATLVNQRLGLLTPQTPTRHGRTTSEYDEQDSFGNEPPSQYSDLIDQVVRSAQRASNRQRGGEARAAHTPPDETDGQYFNHTATFGVRLGNGFAHDSRIGAAGESYVFELLSTLNLPNFTRANWRSTIRGLLSGATHYTDLANWTGRETADIVYADRNGALTQYLRENCEGGFPDEHIGEDWDFAQHPIDYYLEVKSTTGACSARFFMSGGQYKRMEDMALVLGRPTTKVYVIMRVYNLVTPNVGLKVFVDPLRFKGSRLDFEAEKWYVATR